MALGMRRRQDTLQRIETEDRILEVWAPQIAMLERAILARAPQEAGGYRLGLYVESIGGNDWFPFLAGDAKRRRMISGRYSIYDFFRLYPFEPPAVPVVGFYHVRYVKSLPPYREMIDDQKGQESPVFGIHVPFAVRIPNLALKQSALKF